MKNRSNLAVLCLVVALMTPFVSAQEGRARSKGSAYVALDSWVYPVFDRLAALGYVPSQIAGLRPWTRTECARQLIEVERRVKRPEEADIAQFIERMRREFAPELAGEAGRVAMDSAYVRAIGISGAPLTDGYHYGQTIVNDFGRPNGEGVNVVSGAILRADFGPIAVAARGEYQHSAAESVLGQSQLFAARADQVPYTAATRDTSDRGRLLDAYAAVNIRGWQASFGPQSLWWGPGAGGPLLFSNNAEPVTMLRISRVEPFKLPWILSKLGEIRAEAFWGRLDGHNWVALLTDSTRLPFQTYGPVVPQPYIHGEKISFKPTENLEFGVSETTIFGSVGAPLTTHTLLRSYSSANTTPGAPNDPGDRRAGFDIRYRVPGVRNWLTVYVDSMAEDEIFPPAYPRRSAFSPGVYMPKLPGLGKVDLRVEGVYTDIPNLRANGFYYHNVRYRSGYTNNGSLLGSWVGREGRGVQVSSTYWRNANMQFSGSYRYAGVSEAFNGGGRIDDFALMYLQDVGSHVQLSVATQVERWRYPYLSNTTKHNGSVAIELRYRHAASR